MPAEMNRPDPGSDGRGTFIGPVPDMGPDMGTGRRRAIAEGNRVMRAEFEAQVDRMALQHYASKSRWSALSVALGAALVCALLWSQVAHAVLSVWLVLVVCAALVHALLGITSEEGTRIDMDEVPAVPRYRALNASLWLAAAVLGLGLTVLMEPVHVPDQAVILTLLSALAIVVLARMAAVFAPFVGFVCLCIGPPACAMIYRGANSGDGAVAVLGASALASLGALLIAHRSLHLALQGSLWLVVSERARVNRLERFNHELDQDRSALQTESRTDPLTRLANRRHLEETLDGEWNRCRREHQPLSCIILDIDHFKLFNDRYGHDGGDECLRKLGQILTGCLRRPGDLAARYGGEEFMLLLPNTALEGALTVSRQLREAVAAEHIEHADSQTADHVTISLGVATVVPDDRTLMQELPKAADLALYEAKRQGRDRCVAADSQMHDSARMAAKGLIG